MLGDYAAGWRKYECRFQVAEHDPPRAAAVVLDLDRSPAAACWCSPKQGRGDMIQFARYLRCLRRVAPRCSSRCPPTLKPLFERSTAWQRWSRRDTVPPACDRLTPLLSLPLGVAPRWTMSRLRFPTCVCPMRACCVGCAVGAAHETAHRDRVVGFAAHRRVASMPIATLAPVLTISALECHALQKEIPTPDQDWLAAHGLVATHAPACRTSPIPRR